MTLLSITTAEETDGPMMVQRRILLSFCATVLIGVLLCVVYLARRAMSSAPRAKTSAVSVQAGVAVSPVDLRPAALPSQAVPAPTTQVPSLATKRAGREPAPVASAVSDSGKDNSGDTYLQVAAVDRGMAGVLVEVLHRKGFQAEFTSGPTEDIFRVLVGPAKDAEALARTKADLQAAGFTSIVRKPLKLVANQYESGAAPGVPQSAIADK
jgi:cell division septation protein DedD